MTAKSVLSSAYARMNCPHCGVGYAKTVYGRHVELCAMLPAPDQLVPWIIEQGQAGRTLKEMAAVLRVGDATLRLHLGRLGFGRAEWDNLKRLTLAAQRDHRESVRAAAKASLEGHEAKPCAECGLLFDRPLGPGRNPAVAEGDTLCCYCKQQQRTSRHTRRAILAIMPDLKVWDRY